MTEDRDEHRRPHGRTDNPLRLRFTALGEALRARFIERDPLVDAALAALVAGQHLLIIGPPGTAKSQLAAALCAAIEGARGFDWLLTRFTTPEELFGPISLAALERDRYERLTAGKLPEAHVVFLDEVFKASSAILNALLTVLEERRFHNGARAQDVPLVTLVGASNELPEEEALHALYDRFLLRVVVDYIEQDFRFMQLLTMGEPEPLPTVTLDELQMARAAAATVALDGQLLRDLPTLRTRLKEKGIVLSDRRWRKALSVLRASAWLAGRSAADESDLPLLRHVLWNDPDERDEVAAALDGLLAAEQVRMRDLVFQARALAEYPAQTGADEDARARAALEARSKLDLVRREAEGLVETARRRGRAVGELERALAEIDRLRAAVRRALGAALQ